MRHSGAAIKQRLDLGAAIHSRLQGPSKRPARVWMGSSLHHCPWLFRARKQQGLWSQQAALSLVALEHKQAVLSERGLPAGSRAPACQIKPLTVLACIRPLSIIHAFIPAMRSRVHLGQLFTWPLARPSAPAISSPEGHAAGRSPAAEWPVQQQCEPPDPPPAAACWHCWWPPPHPHGPAEPVCPQ